MLVSELSLVLLGVGGAAVPAQAQIIVTAHCPQFTNSAADQTAG